MLIQLIQDLLKNMPETILKVCLLYQSILSRLKLQHMKRNNKLHILDQDDAHNHKIIQIPLLYKQIK